MNMKTFSLAALLLATVSLFSCCNDPESAFPPAVKSYLDSYRGNAEVNQIVFVIQDSCSDAHVSMVERRHSGKKDFWEETMACDAFIGREGTGKQREGDMKTPLGDYGILQVFGIKPDPGTSMPYLQVEDCHYCCGDSVAYNRIIDINEMPHECEGEHLIKYGTSYAYSMFLDYNKECEFGRGSAIFFHCKGSKRYTSGCIAVDEEKMVQILRTIDSNARVIIF